jgi:hypothetical protein
MKQVVQFSMGLVLIDGQNLKLLQLLRQVTHLKCEKLGLTIKSLDNLEIASIKEFGCVIEKVMKLLQMF